MNPPEILTFHNGQRAVRLERGGFVFIGILAPGFEALPGFRCVELYEAGPVERWLRYLDGQELVAIVPSLIEAVRRAADRTRVLNSNEARLRRWIAARSV